MLARSRKCVHEDRIAMLHPLNIIEEKVYKVLKWFVKWSRGSQARGVMVGEDLRAGK